MEELRAPLRRHDGEDRRRAPGEYLGEERRVIDPPTEQDHPDDFNSGSGS